MEDHLIWQIYTRDTAFVVSDKLYYSNIRKLEARNGEVSGLLKSSTVRSWEWLHKCAFLYLSKLSHSIDKIFLLMYNVGS